MARKIFAIKIDEHEKHMMDIIANKSGFTLTNLFSQPIRDSLSETMGLFLLDYLDPTRSNNRAFTTLLNERGQHSLKQTPQAILHMIKIIESEENIVLLRKLFNDVGFQKTSMVPSHNDIHTLAQSMGKKYCDRTQVIDDVDRTCAVNIFVEEMLYMYYRSQAQGSLRHLEQEWMSSHVKIIKFSAKLFEQYDKQLPVEPLEAIEIQALPEAKRLPVPTQQVKIPKRSDPHLKTRNKNMRRSKDHKK